MTTNEMYYLILVLASFCGLGLFLALETVIYRRSLSRIGHLPHDKPHR